MKDEELANPSRRGDMETQSETSDLSSYYHAIRERLWIVILCVVLGGIGAAIFMARQPPRFLARSVLFIEQEPDRLLKDVKDVREEKITSLDMINTVVDVLRSYPFAMRVSEQMKLAQDPRFKGDSVDDPTAKDPAGMLLKSVSAQYRRATRLIDVSVTCADPALAVDIANAYADTYLRQIYEKRSEANKAASRFLLEEAERLRRKMRVSEEAIQSFRERERTASLENLQQTSQAKLIELRTRATALEQKIFQLDTDLKVSRDNPNNIDELLRLPSVAMQPNVARYNDVISDRQREILLINQRYRAKHPLSIASKTQLASLIAERNALLKNVVSLLDTERQHLQSQYDEVKKSLDQEETRLLEITGKGVNYNDLNRELETDRAMYQSMLQRIKEIDVTKGVTDSPVRVHERALGAGPVGVKPAKVYAIGLIGGLAVAIAIALILNQLDQSIKTVDQAEQVTGLPVLAAIPRKTRKAKLKERSLDTVTDRNGIIAESFRSIRASVAMLANADTRRSFLFTSAMPSEGKTFCSSNFSVTLAQQGFRTLLIDADLRKPMVSNVFFGENRKPGLSDVLAGSVPFSEAITTTDIENLSILTAGNRAPNPSELLSTKRLQELIAEAVARFDRVVIDSAPILAVSDSLLVAPYVDVSSLVLRSFATPRKTAARAVKALREIGCRPAGVILNFLPTGAGSYYYYSGKYYGAYKADSVYGSQKGNKKLVDR